MGSSSNTPRNSVACDNADCLDSQPCRECKVEDAQEERDAARAALAKAQRDVAILAEREARAVGLLAKAREALEKIQEPTELLAAQAYAKLRDIASAALAAIREVGTATCSTCRGSRIVPDPPPRGLEGSGGLACPDCEATP